MKVRELNYKYSQLNPLTPNIMQHFNPKTVYISGKITGMPNLNRNKFEAAERYLIMYGYDPINPHKLSDNHDKSWESYMKECVNALRDVDMVVVLDCWKHSRGAIREVLLAQWLGIPVVDIETMQNIQIPLYLRFKLFFNLI